MEISGKTKINDLLNKYPFMKDLLIKKSPKFKNLQNPIMRKTVGKFATLKQVAAMGDLDLSGFLLEIAKEIKNDSNQEVTIREEGAFFSETSQGSTQE